MHKYLRSFSLFLLFALLLDQSNAQNSFTRTNQGRWTLGLNIGGAFQTSDVNPVSGIGGGGYLGYSLYKKPYKTFNVDLRGRFLAARTRGIDLNPSYTANPNPAVNGSYDSNINYSDTDGGYYYANHKTDATEVSLELVVGLNKLRENTGIIFYAFGGGGLYNYKVHIDQKDENGIYNYDQLSDPSLSDLNSFRDNDYESDGYKSSSFKTIPVPTAGYGLGYQLTESVALTLEHKLSFALHSHLDGQAFAAPRSGLFKNDVQHFVGLNLELMFGETGQVPSQEDTEQEDLGSGGTSNIRDENPPSVNITTPSTDPYSTNKKTVALSAKIKNISDKQNIEFFFNAAKKSNFFYDSGSGKLTATLNLVDGKNTVIIKARNQDGKAEDRLTITSRQFDQKTPPTVEFTDPTSSPLTIKQGTYTLKANTSNISSASQLKLMQNGVNKGNFSFNASSGNITYTANLNKGKNVFVIQAKNNDGIASDQTIIIYDEPVNKENPPVVTINNPSNSPHKVNSQAFTVVARISNINQKSQAKVNVNGSQNNSFSFNKALGQVQLPITLKNGPNIINITGVNNSGSDTKSVTIIYRPESTLQPPTVNFTTPSGQSVTVNNSNYTAVAQVTNVSNSSQLTLLVNGNTNNNFNFNSSTLQVLAPLSLNTGVNTVSLTATNSAGSDTKTIKIIRQKSGKGPSVTITDPSTLPYTTQQASHTVKATVKEVKQKNQITVDVNGTNYSQSAFSFNASNNKLILPLNLQKGQNVVTISASNNFGNSSDQAIIVYNKKQSGNPPVVKIIRPAKSPYKSSDCSEKIIATVTNVSNKQGITVLKDGAIISPNKWYFKGGKLAITDNIQTVSKYTISASNGAGSDQKSTTIKCDKKITICHIPPGNPNNPQTIKIPASAWPAHKAHGDSKGACSSNAPAPTLKRVNPGSSPYTSSNCEANVVVQTTNVSSSNQISVTKNGTVFNGWSFSNSQVTWKESISGTVKYNVQAKTKGGSANEVIIIKCEPKITICHIPPGNPNNPQTITISQSAWAAHKAHGDSKGACTSAPAAPTVNRVKPSGSPYTSPDCEADVKVKTTNVSSSSEITVTRNGSNFTAWNFSNNMVTWKESITGTVNYVVTATTAGGSDSETISIKCDPKITICHIPPGNPNNPQTITISQSAWAAHKAHGDTKGACTIQPPELNLLKPSSSPHTAPDCKADVIVKTENISKAKQIKVTKNGSGFSGWSFKNNRISWKESISGTVTYVVTASNSSGSANEMVIVKCEPKITICHIPPGNPNNPQTLQIPKSAWPAHQAHGDSKGKCPTYNPPQLNRVKPGSSPHTSSSCKADVRVNTVNIQNKQQISITKNGSAFSAWTFSGNSITWNESISGTVTYVITATTPGGNTSETIEVNCSSGNKITICHIPPGNPSNPQTISISPNAWPAHKAHGDSKGACPAAPSPPSLSRVKPGSSPYTSSNCKADVKVQTNNVSNSSEITVTRNGSAFTGWSFSNNKVSWKESITGTVNYVVTATTAGGTDSETIVVKCDPKINICHIPPGNPDNPQEISIPQSAWSAHKSHGDIKGKCPSKPTVRINKPSNKSTLKKPGVKLQAKVSNVSKKSDVKVKLNGSSVSFSYSSSGNISANLKLKEGANMIQVSASNKGGSASQSHTVIYSKPKKKKYKKPGDNGGNKVNPGGKPSKGIKKESEESGEKNNRTAPKERKIGGGM